MADITMCEGTDCTLKMKCLRYTAYKGLFQSYLAEVPYNKETGTCPYILSNEGWTNHREKQNDIH